jgi:hypothetical protein
MYQEAVFILMGRHTTKHGVDETIMSIHRTMSGAIQAAPVPPGAKFKHVENEVGYITDDGRYKIQEWSLQP